MKEPPEQLVRMMVGWQFTWNLDRLRNLLHLYDLSTNGSGRRRVDSSDVLRAAVVLLHATFEEVLRDFAKDRWPFAEENILNGIPLVGVSQYGRPEKFYLGKLACHRGKTVEQVIEESVKAYLAQFTIGNVAELVTFLRSVGVSPKPFTEVFPALEQMMKRRHQIVHEADRNESRGRGQHAAQSIGKATVEGWIGAVERFLHILQRVPWTEVKR